MGQVQAEDADSGINGEIYFSLVDPNSPFAVDPVTGVISLTRPLSYAKNPRHTINVVAQDRGAKSRFAMRAPDTAKVQLSVRQVISVLGAVIDNLWGYQHHHQREISTAPKVIHDDGSAMST